MYRVILRDLGLPVLKGDSREVCDVISSPLFTVDGESPEDLREKARSLARKIIMQYKIGDQDAVAFEDLLPEITQARLLGGANGYRVYASVAINTGCLLESGTPISPIKMTWSPDLVRVFLEGVFDRIYIFKNGGLQFRVSTNPIFKRSVAMVIAIVGIGDQGIADVHKCVPKIIKIAPLYDLESMFSDWETFCANI